MDATPDTPKFVAEDLRFTPPVRLRVNFDAYAKDREGGVSNIAIVLKVDGDQGEHFDGEPWTTVTRNFTEVSETMPPDVLAVANYSENSGLDQALVRAGVLEPKPVGEIQSGMVTIPLYRMTPQAFAAAQQACAKPKASAARRPAA